ncbi:tandem-95 repeat protein [Marinoscillum furvescens]|uniref:Putative secreted protein (Por secretion system target) n=1 Tax=Marinoscillum furvescens DSM 4134 TaxID=1122208 RepID=A0A3D9L5P2_MARFU|nr:tandem-95 repeat protein [Marinoscillum furvescens]REE01520.1 putative secreted protein (Por secretion system target) [Marinoscillum furvescens DSM 4134]
MKKSILLSILILTGIVAYAQRSCTDGYQGGTGFMSYQGLSSYAIGQTFTACRSGLLQSISFELTGAHPTAMTVYLKDGAVNGSTLETLYLSPHYGKNTIDVANKGVMLTAGQTYALRFGGNNEYYLKAGSNANDYPNGSAWQSSPTGVTAQNFDLSFEYTVKIPAIEVLAEDFNSFSPSGNEVPEGWEADNLTNIHVATGLGTASSNALVFSSATSDQHYVTLPEFKDLHTRVVSFQVSTTDDTGAGPSNGTVRLYQSVSGDPDLQSTNTLLKEITLNSNEAFHEVSVNVAQLGGSGLGEFFRLGFQSTHENVDSKIILDDFQSRDNTAPTGISLSDNILDENVAAGTVVGTLTTTDPTSGDTFTYTLGGFDAAAFTVANNNELQIVASPDFETQSSYAFDITSTDALGESITRSFSVTINDLYENGPNEEVTTYAFSNGDISDGINNNDLTDHGTTPQPDRFGAADSARQFGDGTYLTIIDPIIDITEDFTINFWFKREGDSPTNTYLLDSRHSAVNHGGEVGGLSIYMSPSSALNVAAYKTAGGFGNTLGMGSPITTNLDEWYMATIVHANDSIYLYQDGALQSQAKPSQLQNGDGWIFGGISQSGSRDWQEFPGDQDDFTFFAKALDVTEITALFHENNFNKSKAPTDVTLSDSTVYENLPSGTAIGKLIAVDPDASEAHTFTISGSDASNFDVRNDSLVTAAVLDFEVKDSFEIAITAKDPFDKSFTKSFLIAVLDTNDAPTDIQLTAQSVAENLPAGTVVGTLSGTDQDVDDVLSFALSSSDFEIEGNQLKTATTFDFESESSHTINISVIDSDSAYFSKDFTIDIEDVTAPQVIDSLENMVKASGFDSYSIDLTDVFFHDQGDPLVFTASSNETTVATTSVSGSNLIVTEAGEGTTTITVTADDQSGSALATTSFELKVADLQSDLIAYYPTPDAQDASGTGNDATAYSLLSTSDRFGNEDQAMLFDGSVVDMPKNLLTKNAVSISLWFKTDQTGGILGYQQTSFTSTPSAYVPIIYIGNNNELKASFWEGMVTSMPGGSLNDDSWHHLVLTATTGQQKLYIDDVLVATTNRYNNLSTLAFNQLGAAYTDGSWPHGNGEWFYYDGAMDDIRIYERVLTADQVHALHHEPAPEQPEVITPLADVTLDEDAPAQVLVADLSEVFSNPNNGDMTFAVSHTFGSEVDFSIVDGSSLRLDTLAANFNGTGEVIITASEGIFTIADTFALTIAAVNDAPLFELDEKELYLPIDFSKTVLVEVNAAAVPTDETSQTISYSIAPTVTFANVSIDATTGEITITSVAGATGSETLTVSADDGQAENNLATATLTLTVSDNSAPTVENPIANQSMDEDGTLIISGDITSVFDDADGDPLTYSAAADTSAVTPTITDGELAIALAANYHGTATITLTADDGQTTTDHEITLVVNPVNDAPEVTMTIADMSVAEDAAFNYEIPSTLFWDVDGDDTSIESVEMIGLERTEASWLNYNAKTNTLSGTPLQENIGTVEVTITGSDDELSSSTAFLITVTNTNDLPVISQELSINADEDDAPQTIDLNEIFSDEDGDDLTYTILTSGEKSLEISQGIISASIQEHQLTVAFTANAYGTTHIAIQAADAQGSITYQLPVTVAAVNDAPEIVSTPVIQLAEDGNSYSFSLSEHFRDIEKDPLSYTLAENTSSLFTASLEANTLTITPLPNQFGTGEVTVVANDGSDQTNMTITVTVIEVNDLPVIVSEPVINLMEDAASAVLDLSAVFSDPEGSEISYSILVNDASSELFSIALNEQSLEITPLADAFGSGEITITAYDSPSAEIGTTYTLPVAISSVNDAPAFQLSTSVLELEVDFAGTTLVDILMDVPANESDEDITFTVSTDEELVNITVNGQALEITAIAGAIGEATVTVTANDGQKENASYTQSFVVTVSAPLAGATNQVKIFPNPASSYLMVELPAATTVSVLDLNGSIVLQGLSNQKLDISKLPEGIYLLRFEANSEMTSRKILIRH